MTKDFPYSSVGKESPCNAGDLGSILGSERSPGEGNGNRFQYSCFLPGESQGQRSLAGYSPWGHKSRTRLSGYTTNTMCGRLRNGEKKRCLFFPPPWEFQTSFSSSLGTPDFLSTYLGIDSLRMRWLDGVTNSWTWVWVSSRSWWWTGRPVCCSPWGHKESDTTEQLNWIPTIYILRWQDYS